MPLTTLPQLTRVVPIGNTAKKEKQMLSVQFQVLSQTNAF